MALSFQRHINALKNISDPRVQDARDFLIEVSDIFDGLEANSTVQAGMVDTVTLNVGDLGVRAMLMAQMSGAKDKVRQNFTRIKDL